MAKIKPNDSAPSEAVHYTFANASFDLGGSNKSYETDDVSVISDAQLHPWLTVEIPVVEAERGSYVEQLRPEDDAMSSLNDKSNDPEAVKAAEDAKDDDSSTPVALDAGLDQTTARKNEPIARTLAADETSKTSEKTKD